MRRERKLISPLSHIKKKKSITEGKKEGEGKKNKHIVTTPFPSLRKTIILTTQGPQQTSSLQKKHGDNHTIIKLIKISNKEKNIKRSQRIKMLCTEIQHNEVSRFFVRNNASEKTVDQHY